MSRRWITNTFVLGGVATSAVALASSRDLGGIFILVWSSLCSVLVVRAALKMQGKARPAFLTLGLAGLIFLAGIVVRTAHGEAIGVDQPLPSPADLFHVPGYLLFLLIAVQLHLARTRQRDIDAWVDSLSFSISLAAILWALFLGEFVLGTDDSALEVALHAGYNAVLIATLAVGLRIGATPGSRQAPYYLLGAGCAAFLIADLNATWASTTGQTAYLTIALSPLIYGFCAGAAFHPLAEKTFSQVDRAETESRSLRSLFILGSLTAPVIVVLVGLRADTAVRNSALAASVVVALLVSFRVFRLLGAEAESRRQERKLSEELATLATMPSPGALRGSLIQSASQIASGSFTIGKAEALSSETSHTSFELPTSLRSEPSQECHLVVEPAFTTAQEKRLISTLVRESGHFAAALEVTAKLERQKSEAVAAEKIAANERRFRSLLQNSADTIVVFEKETGVVTFISESVERVLGYRPEDFLGKTLAWVTYKKDWDFAVQGVLATQPGDAQRTEYEVRAIHADGSVRLLECSAADMTNVEGIEGVVMNATDRTQMRELESNLLHAETLDPLTSLLNRGAFIKEIEAATRRASVRNSSVAIAVIDIDDFRSVNDGYGTAVGDRVLLKLASRIKQMIRNDDAICRLSGDRFGVMFPAGYSTREVEGLLERILEVVQKPVDVEGHTIVLSATSGVFIDKDFDSDAVTILGHADTALDAAKQAHRGGLLHFRSEMGLEASTRIEIRNRLRLALTNGGLRLNFQPIVDLESGQIVSLEALARWDDPVLGEISPGTFIPIAESSGLISDLGEWALRRACEHLCEWDELGFGHITVSVNMSGHQLRDDRTIEQVRSILKETGVTPSRITIELTESVLLDDTNFTAERISKLRQLGLRLAIDDFGTGYSSFGYLRRYVFDIIKIDRSFVAPLRDDKNVREREIVNAMIKLSQALGATTIGEGVEQSEEHGVLRTLGCDQAQGYLLFRPTEAREIPELLRKEADPSIIDS